MKGRELKRIRQSFSDKLRRINFAHEFNSVPMSDEEIEKLKGLLYAIYDLADSLEKEIDNGQSRKKITTTCDTGPR